MAHIFVLGGTGMLGHKLTHILQKNFEVTTTNRGASSSLKRYTGLFNRATVVSGFDAGDIARVEQELIARKPDVVINAVGIIKQLEQAKNARTSIKMNALFPHELASICQKLGSRLFLISTDCVFDGARGDYCESDLTDAVDLYGRTKALGEASDTAGIITLRTSIIGRELFRRTGLLEWFLAQPEGSTLKGYRKAIYTGVTTIQLAEVIRTLIEAKPLLSGLFQVVSHKIDKFELLCRLRDTFKHPVEIEPFDQPAIDRSLRGDLFFQKTGIPPFSWDQLMVGLASDDAPYSQWRTE